MFRHCASAWVDTVCYKLGTYATMGVILGQKGLMLDEKYSHIDSTVSYSGPGILGGCIQEIKYSACTGTMYVLLSALSTCSHDASCADQSRCQMYVTASCSQCPAHRNHKQYET